MVKTIVGAPKTTWRDRGRIVSYNNLEVSLSKWRLMIQSLVERATELLNTRILFDARATLFGGSGEYHRPNGVRDNVDERRAGYSFVDEHQFFYGKSTALMKLVVATPELQTRFLLGLTPGGDLRWNSSEIASWLADVDEFVILLAILFYFLGGQPPRGPELLSHRMQNTPFAMRNIYCIQNRLVSSLEYTKSENMTGTSLPVARIMAHVVQELAEVYIILVRPFQNSLHRLLNSNPETPFTNFTALLFTREGRPMTVTQFSHYLREQSRRYIKHDWGIKVWRQVIITFSQALLPKEIQVMTLATTVLARQASHQQATSDANYNVQSDASLSGINTVRYMQFFLASTAYHEMLGFQHPVQASSDYSFASTSKQGTDLRDHTNAVITGVVSGVADLLKEVNRQQNLSEVINASDRHVEPFAKFTPLHNIQVADTTLAFLRRLYPGGHFRTKEQAQAVQYVLENHPDPLLVIQPLASGKSTLFHVAAIAEASIMGVSVVLVPLVSLAQATVDAAQKKGITAHHVTPLYMRDNSARFPNVQIVVMTYDLFLESQKVQLWIRAKITEKLVRRIVVDEVHMVVTDINFRSSFRTMFDTLSQLHICLVLLTGTLSIAQAEELRSTMNMFPVIRISRLSTERPNLCYRVCQKLSASDDTVKAFCALVRSVLIPKLEANRRTRAIIYTHSVKWAEEIGEELRIPVYTQLADKEVKKKALDAWLNLDDEETLSVSKTNCTYSLS
jgi:DEAD/DEAH box helicase